MEELSVSGYLLAKMYGKNSTPVGFKGLTLTLVNFVKTPARWLACSYCR